MSELRVLSWNLWHALNPYGRLRMRRMESPKETEIRRKKQETAIRNWLRGPGDILCFQELNPVRSRTRLLSKSLRMRGECALANSGLKFGTLGIPPLLSEGLGIFLGSGFSELKFEDLLLSGGGFEFHFPFSVDLSLQVAERRKALFGSGVFLGKKIVVINLHLHHGPDSIASNAARRAREVSVLCDRLRSRLKDTDLAILCGDFNSDADSPTMEPLLKLGFQDCGGVSASPTWDPASNPLAALSSKVATNEKERAWDATPHLFDRIYVYGGNSKRVQYSQVREAGLSDHYAVCVEITW